MRQLIRWPVLLILAAVLVVTVVQTASQNPPAAKTTNPDAATLAAFQERVKEYVKLHEDVEKGRAQPKETNDPAKIREAQVALGEEIRAARANARPGDIFTPDVRALFRKLMYPEVKGADGHETKSEIKEDAPKKPVPLKVNSLYPEGQPLPTVPANVLKNLPQLPEQLEYRIIDKNLILRDVDANLIVDYIPNAIR